MPTPTAMVFRPGRRSHRGRPGRRGIRSRTRAGFAGRCSTSWEKAPSSASPSAAPRSLARRARAASARVSALATSSSASAAAASGPSGSCTEKQLITSAWAQRCHRPAAFVAPHMRKCALGRDRAEWRTRSPGAHGGSVQVIFSNGENFLFRCGKVIGCDRSWLWLPRCSAPVCWPRRRPSPGQLSATTPTAPRASCRIRF